MAKIDLNDSDYQALATFRHTVRAFLAFSEGKATAEGLTPQQHQALLVVRAAPKEGATIGYVADRLFLQPHSASGLIARLEKMALLKRRNAAADHRQIILALTAKSSRVLAELSATHREELRRLRPMLMELLEGLG